MQKRVLITTTSLQDTPGEHQQLLKDCGWEITTARGPLTEAQMLDLVGQFDGIICGDDVYSQAVLEKARPRLKILSKYGIGVDKIDVKAATALSIPVLFTPGVNHTTVAEHTFALMLALNKNLIEAVGHTRAGNWKRPTGHEIWGKTIGVVGLGRIGKEVVIRAKAFGMHVIAMDKYIDEAFVKEYGVKVVAGIDEMIDQVDVLSLHCNLNEQSREMINTARLSKMKPEAIVINCARGEIVKTEDMVAALNAGTIAGYGTDVLDEEPPRKDHPLCKHPRCIVTPHIGSRTYESVVRQATKAVMNLKLAFEGKAPLAQVNEGVSAK